MPIFLFAVGTLFLAAAIRGKHELLFSTLKDDFTGPNNFFYWAIALFIIGAIGYYKPLKPFSNAFMTLTFVVLMLAHNRAGQRGFFSAFMDQIGSTKGG